MRIILDGKDTDVSESRISDLVARIRPGGLVLVGGV